MINLVSGEMQPKKIFYVWKKTTSKVWKKTQSAKCLEGCVWNTMSGGKPFSGQMSGSMCLEVCPPPQELCKHFARTLKWQRFAIQGESGNLQVTGTYQVIVPITSNFQMPTM